MRPKIYLAGPMLGCTPDQMSGWREEVKQRLGMKCDFADPVLMEIGETEAHKLVTADLKAIKQADLVLAYCWKPSPGTAMELVYANRIYEVPVLSVNLIESPWVKFHSDYHADTLNSAIDFLLTANIFEL
jgi:nucleoside 2-deoxyribosyltransferase